MSDPSLVAPEESARPVAVCSYSGYLGSAWDDVASDVRSEVDDARANGMYMMTQLQVDGLGISSSGWTLRIWLPRPQDSLEAMS